MADHDTHVNPNRGLWIPLALREFDRQVVFRTPRATIQHFQRGEGRGQLEGYYGLIDETHFGPAEELRDPRNPDLAPNQVSIKPEGEEPVVLTVDTDPDPLPDGGTVEMGECRVCERTVPLDGEEAMERFGSPLCRDCTDEPVIFEAECTNQLCGWSYRREGDEFDRGHVEQLVRNEANNHQRRKRVFDDDPTHKTEVREVEPVTDGGTEGPNAAVTHDDQVYFRTRDHPDHPTNPDGKQCAECGDPAFIVTERMETREGRLNEVVTGEPLCRDCLGEAAGYD